MLCAEYPHLDTESGQSHALFVIVQVVNPRCNGFTPTRETVELGKCPLPVIPLCGGKIPLSL